MDQELNTLRTISKLVATVAALASMLFLVIKVPTAIFVDLGIPSPEITVRITLLAAIVALVLSHHHNLSKYVPRRQGWFLTLAHIGGTGVFASLAIGIVLAIAVLSAAVSSDESLRSAIATVVIALSLYPVSYYCGRVAADFMGDQKPGRIVAGLNTGSAHHDSQQYRINSPSDYFKIKDDHADSYTITWIPLLLMMPSIAYLCRGLYEDLQPRSPRVDLPAVVESPQKPVEEPLKEEPNPD